MKIISQLLYSQFIKNIHPRFDPKLLSPKSYVTHKCSTYTIHSVYITSTRVKTRKDHGPEGTISRPNICTQSALYRTRSGQMESARKAGAFAGESGVPILIRLHGPLKSEVRSFKGEGGGGETPLDNALVKRVDTAVKIDIFRDGHDTPTDANNSPLPSPSPPVHGRIHRPVDNPARNLVTLVSRNYRGPRISTMNSTHPAFEPCVWNSPEFVRNAPGSYLNLLHLSIRIISSGRISVFQEDVFMEFLG